MKKTNTALKTRLATLFLVFALAPASFSCKTGDGASAANPAGSADENAAGEAFGPAKQDSLPDGLDFGGQTLNLFTHHTGNRDFFAESETGELVDDAKYISLIKTEERLNMKTNFIRDMSEPNDNAPFATIRASISSGDLAYDLIDAWGQKLTPLSVDGLLANMFDVPHLELSKPWWNKSIIEELTVKNKLFLAVGDANHNAFQYINAIGVNKDILKDNGLPDLYGVVFEGRWTIDYMHNLIKGAYRDLNGDGIADFGDMYGIAWPNYNAPTMIMDSANAHVIKKGPDGNPSFDPDREKLARLADKTYELFFENPGSFWYLQGTSDNDYNAKFPQGELLLHVSSLDEIGKSIRIMEQDCGIVPFPKYDEDEKNYYSYVYYVAAMLSVPANCDKAELVGAFMEATACDAYYNITPVYFDTVMNIKVARDEETIKMVDVIRNSAYFSFEKIYSASVGGAGDLMFQLMFNKDRNVASWLEKNENAIKAAIDALIENFEENE